MTIQPVISLMWLYSLLKVSYNYFKLQEHLGHMFASQQIKSMQNPERDITFYDDDSSVLAKVGPVENFYNVPTIAWDYMVKSLVKEASSKAQQPNILTVIFCVLYYYTFL